MSFSNIPIGSEAPEIVNAIIEIPKGSHCKYEYDEKIDNIKLDRVLHSSVIFPTEYGFIPQTRSEDGEQLDIMVINKRPAVFWMSGCRQTHWFTLYGRQ